MAGRPQKKLGRCRLRPTPGSSPLLLTAPDRHSRQSRERARAHTRAGLEAGPCARALGRSCRCPILLAVAWWAAVAAPTAALFLRGAPQLVRLPLPPPQPPSRQCPASVGGSPAGEHPFLAGAELFSMIALQPLPQHQHHQRAAGGGGGGGGASGLLLGAAKTIKNRPTAHKINNVATRLSLGECVCLHGQKTLDFIGEAPPPCSSSSNTTTNAPDKRSSRTQRGGRYHGGTIGTRAARSTARAGSRSRAVGGPRRPASPLFFPR